MRECCEPKEDKLQDHCLRGREWEGNCDQSDATLQKKESRLKKTSETHFRTKSRLGIDEGSYGQDKHCVQSSQEIPLCRKNGGEEAVKRETGDVGDDN